MNLKLCFISVLTITLLMGCGGADPNVATSQVILQGQGFQWMIDFQLLDCNEDDYPVEPTVIIRNRIDRNIQVDFDGPAHKRVSIGDNSKKMINLPPGYYKIMASAPGLSYVPSNYGQTLNQYCQYMIVFVKTKIKTSYTR